ncbi:splicing factor ESS-2 homolog [Helicoverpa armigera]|uniref:splicing factor ESS-2 homolog n=1 Tax=Helicoverpa zea TaxID=7113 RepID=UPI001F582636|nr:splicing factor ESS-2 homolog [Helicoverpa zea]
MSGDNKTPRPGAAALENMKLLKHESAIFKVPKVPKKKEKKKAQVLDEDVYVEGIAKIIQRDFFPDLEKLKAQNEFLEATENKDYARLRELTRKYNGQRPPTEPYNSPATFDTPHMDRPFSPAAPTIRSDRSDTESECSSRDKTKDITDNHSLDSYLSTHTSEDNASYDRVIALENKKRAAKLATQLQAEVTSAAIADAALALPSIEQQADQTERPHELDTWRYKAKNYIMYVPDGAESQRPPPKPELIHQNTRLKVEPFDHVKNKEAISAIARSQDASVTGKIGVDGVSISAEPGGGYAFVGTPSPRPGEGPDASPLMTWGEIEGTPFRLDGGDTPLPAVGAGAAYRMLEGGSRERIALQLAEQAARRRRPTTPRQLPPTPSFRSNTERLASMSPAARKLAAKHLLSPRLRLTPNDMGILSHASPKRTPTPQRRLVAPARPSPRPSRAGSVNNTGVTEDLTDNLLQINVAKRTRLKAQDFFK